jgi:protein TonB
MALKSWGFPPYALVLSLVLHALALAALAPWVAERSQAVPPAAALQGRLLPAPTAAAAPAQKAPQPARPEVPSRSVRAEGVAAAPQPTVLSAPTFPATVPAVAPGAVAGGEAVVRPAEVPATSALRLESEARGPSESGLRQYRLALATEARRFRRYPEAARRAGLAGTAEVRVTVMAGGTQRVAELNRSSGHAALDAAALEMLRQAARQTALPESLREQNFSVLLPVLFEVEE